MTADWLVHLADFGSLWQLAARNYALVSIVITAIVLIVVPVLIIAKYVRLILPMLTNTTPPLAPSLQDFAVLDGETVDFRAFDGHPLVGMILTGQHRGRPKGMIVFAHEYTSNRQSCARYCRPMLEAGYDVFSFDFRGHGDSGHEEGYEPRQWSTEREVSDLVGALAYLADRLEGQGRPPEVGIFGISRGASAAVIAAVNHEQVRAIVCDGLYSSDKLLERLMKRWAYIFAKVRFVYENHPPEFWRFLRWAVFSVAQRQLKCTFPSTRKALLRMSPRPILFIHGEKDCYVPVELAQDLHDQAGDPKELWIVPKAKHNQAVVVTPEQYAKKTVDFFDRYLASEIVDPVETLVESVVAEAAQPYEPLPSPRIIPSAPVVKSQAARSVTDRR